MAYGNLYQGRKDPIQAPAPAPQPNNQSMVEHFRAQGKLPDQDASRAHYTDAQRARAREIRHAMDSGQWTFGNIVPHDIAALVYDGACPESAPEMMAHAGGSLVGRLSQQITASLATDAPVTRRGLATDNQPGRGRNDLAPDHAQLHRGTMSYELSRIMGDHVGVLPEDVFDSELLRAGVTDVSRRISLKHEAMHLGVMRARGALQGMTTHPGMMEDAMIYPPGMQGEIVENEDGTTSLHLRGKIDKETLDKMRKMLTPKKGKVGKGPDGEGLTLKASTDQGYTAYDGTSFWVASGLDKV